MEYNPMPVPGGVAAPRGFWATGVKAQVKYTDKYDVALIFSEQRADAAGVYTRNQVKAHPLLLTQKHLRDGKAQAVVANSGNANACVGEKGDQAALAMAAQTAEKLGIELEDVIVASTGVIGVELPIAPVSYGIEAGGAVLKTRLDQTDAFDLIENAHQAALAIMTTDTRVKELAYEISCAQGKIRIGAIAKGSGMIHPNMGTMLGFITTDAVVDGTVLQDLLIRAVDDSFNMVTVDGDTSTNDMVTIMANGCSGIKPEGVDWANFEVLVFQICRELAKAIAGDGEGATKLLVVNVKGAQSLEAGRKIAKSICGSSLVKTAMFGEDANWGRILAAAGYAGVEFDPGEMDIYLGELQVAEKGMGLNFSEEKAKEILSQPEITVNVHMPGGAEMATAWGCDLTYDYVKINGSYRT